ncbi:hypothetical protein BV25DRAFT_1913496 [Artomyces pyxidatus]|uniref:Uncharacterized protein n=1 Tax=Artomyces pyxidatus TaxID=48021 RepID=A0ACB8T9D5_9AGAM|nr:hypothetical protein BV25DRAFT_1913496 [Artomyces pyxidatus]
MPRDPIENASEPSPPNAQLLDEEGEIAEQLEACLKHIFAKYCTPALSEEDSKKSKTSPGQPPENAFLDSDGLDSWARDTNGAPLSDTEKEDLLLLDVTDDGGLTFQGFLQIYQLQTENDEEETWRDLARHGFDRSLRLVGTHVAN